MCECKICKSQVSKEAEAWVNSELAKMILDPSYKPKTYDPKTSILKGAGKTQ